MPKRFAGIIRFTLLPGGFLALETNGGEQAHTVAGMLRGMLQGEGNGAGKGAGHGVGEGAGAGEGEGEGDRGAAIFENVRVRMDYCGVERFVTAWKAPRLIEEDL